jgi:hypothetical protein
MAKIILRIKQQCDCKKCITYAEITEFACGCITVKVFNKAEPSDECTHFNEKSKHCGQYGYPEDHKIRQ